MSVVKGKEPQVASSGARPAERRESRPERTRTLQLRLALLVVAVTSPVLFFFAILSLYAISLAANADQRAAVHDSEDQARRAAKFLDDLFGQMNLEATPENRRTLQTYLESLARTRKIYRGIAIFRRPEDDDRGDRLETVAKSFGVEQDFPQDPDRAALREDKIVVWPFFAGDAYLQVSSPLHARESNVVVGVVHAEIQTPSENEKVLAREPFRIETPIYLGLVALAAVGVSGAALVFALDRAIGRPVEALVAVMERARQGDLDAQIEVAQMDEFGWLGENFNRMLRRLKENDASLRELMAQAARFTDELKTKVQQATQELAGKNDELARANQRLFEAQRALGQSERLASLGQFASQMAHEIGTPLNSIYGHIQLLGQDEISDGARKRIAIVESQVERLTKIIENVLRTLRLPDAQLREIDVNPTLQGLAAFTQPVAANRNIRLVLELKEGIPQVYVDSRQLEQVLLNLFTNALDAMPSGGTLTLESGFEASPSGEGAVPATSAAAADDEGERVLIRVRDTGVGIPQENLLRIFEPFFTTKPPGEGTGLGLPVCKQILRVFRGSLSASSEGPGKGSCFTVGLPAVRKKSTDAPPPPPPLDMKALTTDSGVFPAEAARPAASAKTDEAPPTPPPPTSAPVVESGKNGEAAPAPPPSETPATAPPPA